MGKKILLVDDELAIRNVVTRFLEKHGFKVVAAPDVARALNHLKQEADFDLCISDFGMPEKSGLDLLRWIRSHSQYSELPVIIQSGSLYAQAREDLAQLNPQAMLEKPVAFDELLAYVRMFTQTGSKT